MKPAGQPEKGLASTNNQKVVFGACSNDAGAQVS